MKKKSLGLNAVLNGIKSLLNLVFPLLTFPYISRILTVKGIGINNFANTFVGYFVLVAQLGINNYAIREGARFRNNISEFNKFANEVFSINIISTILAYVSLLITLICFDNLQDYISCILIYSIQILFTTLGVEWIYIIYEDYAYITVRSIIFNILSIVLLFILVKKAQDYLIYAGITIFATVGSNILNFIKIRSKVKIRFIKKINLKKHIVPILILFAANVSSAIYMSCDNTILGLFKGDYAVGIYSITVKIYTMCKSLILAGITVTIPRLAMLYGQKRKKEYDKVISNVFDILTLIALPATVGLILLSKEVVIILASKKYLPSVTSLQIIALATLFSLFSYILSSCVLIPAKREKYVLKETIIASVVNIILNIWLIPKSSYNAAAITTVISELTALSIGFYYSKDIISNTLYSKERLKNLFHASLGSAGIIIVCLFSDEICNSLISKAFTAVIFSIVVYASTLFLLKNKYLLIALSYFKNLIGKNR